MSFSEFLLNLAIGSLLFVVYVMEFFRNGNLHLKTPARVTIPVSNPRSSIYATDNRLARKKWYSH